MPEIPLRAFSIGITTAVVISSGEAPGNRRLTLIVAGSAFGKRSTPRSRNEKMPSTTSDMTSIVANTGRRTQDSESIRIPQPEHEVRSPRTVSRTLDQLGLKYHDPANAANSRGGRDRRGLKQIDQRTPRAPLTPRRADRRWIPIQHRDDDFGDDARAQRTEPIARGRGGRFAKDVIPKRRLARPSRRMQADFLGAQRRDADVSCDSFA